MRVLTFNSHEAYVFDLARVGYALDVVVDLPGHHMVGWDERMRPLPSNASLIGMADVLAGAVTYDCIIAHSITDLLAVKQVRAPKVLVLHSSLTGRLKQERSGVNPAEVASTVEQYIRHVKGVLVMISEMKRASWQLDARVIPAGIDVDDYSGYRGEVPTGLRVANGITKKREYLNWSFHEAVVRELPCHLVGHNPDLAGVEPSRDWEHLKELYRAHRFYVHTAAPGLEDGYNLTVLEAMATGMPVVASAHPTSPVCHGENGFISDDVEELKAGARQLLDDPELARQMGAAARETIKQRFPMSEFIANWRAAIDQARARFAS